MKKHFLVALMPLVFIACKKDRTVAPADSQAAIVGTWKETAIYNYTYDRGALIEIDTIPAMTNSVAMYTDFLPGGNYTSYTLTGNSHTDAIFDKYVYHANLGLLVQDQPAKSANRNNNNVNYIKSMPSTFINSAWDNMYDIVSLDDKQLIITQKLNYFDFEDSDTPRGYVMQMRILTKQ